MEPITPSQLKVLAWIAEGYPDDGRWSAPGAIQGAKASARALHNRKLVIVENSARAGWSAEMTDAGRHYLEHGTYPKGHKRHNLDLTPVERPDSRSEEHPPTRTPSQTPETDSSPGTTSEPAPKRSFPSASSSEPIVRLLKANPHWVRVEPELFGRALKIAQYIARAARESGWGVELPSHPGPEWPGWTIDTYAWRIESLTLDLPHARIPITFRSFRDSKTGVRRLRVFARTGHPQVKVDDTKLTFVEDKIDRLLDFAAEESLSSQRRAHEAEVQRAERKKQEDERADQSRRVREYSAWQDTFLEVRGRWIEYQQTIKFVEEFVENVAGRGDDSEKELVTAYVEWAKRYAIESDPFDFIPLPPGAIPDMTFKEWRKAQSSRSGPFRFQ